MLENYEKLGYIPKDSNFSIVKKTAKMWGKNIISCDRNSNFKYSSEAHIFKTLGIHDNYFKNVVNIKLNKCKIENDGFK